MSDALQKQKDLYQKIRGIFVGKNTPDLCYGQTGELYFFPGKGVAFLPDGRDDNPIFIKVEDFYCPHE